MAFYGSGEKGRAQDDPAAILLIPLTLVMVGLLAVFFVVFHYSTVAGPSMRPTLLAEDRLLLTKSYKTPRRGDVVVFTYVDRGQSTQVVKRVVALAGDTVLMRGDVAWVNGSREPTGHDMILGQRDVPFGPYTVPAGTVFVLGDNRPVSLDSRFIGPVAVKDVMGRVVAIFSPVTRLRLVPAGTLETTGTATP